MNATVLVVEADASVRRVVRRGLERYGLTVLEAATGPAAVGLLAGDPDGIGAVVAGELVPGLDGVQLAEALAAARPTVRLFFYVGDSISSDLFALQGVEFFLKPHGLLALCSAVAERLDEQLASRAATARNGGQAAAGGSTGPRLPTRS